MERKNFLSKTVRSISNVAIMLVLSSFFAYILRVILARKLTPDDFALFYATITFMLFLLIFRDLGTKTALIRFIAFYNGKKAYGKIKTLIASAFIFQLLSSSILIIAFLTLRFYLAENYFSSSTAASILLVLAFYVFFSMINALVYAILVGFEETKWYSLSEPLRLGISLVAFFPLFALGYGILAAPIAFVIGVFSTSVILSIKLFKYRFILQHKIKDFWATTKEIFSFSLPVVFTGLGSKVIAHIDVLMLTYFVPLAALADYQVVLPTALLFLFLGNAVSTVLYPLISKLWGSHKFSRSREVVKLAYTYLSFLTLPAILAVFLFAQDFIALIFTDSYIGGILAFRILLVGVFFYVITVINNTILSAIGKPLAVTKIVTGVAIFNIILNLILIPQFGINGAAITTALSYVVSMFISLLMVRRYTAIHAPWLNWFKIVLVGIVSFVISFVVKGLFTSQVQSIIITVLTLFASYLLLSLLMRIIEFKNLRGMLNLLITRNS